MNSFSSQLHITYQKSITAFLNNIKSSDRDLPKKIDGFARTCAMCLWSSFDVDPSLCIEPLSEMYTKENERMVFSEEEIAETFAYIKNNSIDITIPDFFKSIVQDDYRFGTNYSRIFAEGMKMIFINCALIDDDLSFEEARAITRYSQILLDVCDENEVKSRAESIDPYKYVSSTSNQVSAAKAIVKSEIKKTKVDNCAEDDVDPLVELSKLIGLESVKHEIDSLQNLVKVQQLRKLQGLPTTTMSYHLVFTGNPGTGKTTVARLVAKIYKNLGVLSKGQLVEAKSSDLVAGYVGQTAIKTHELVEKALGGVLFIDEAYTLVDKSGQNNYGQEAIDTLLKDMEDNRNDLIVIVAGYDELMNGFITSNPGLQSRFNKYIHFEDYSEEELLMIYKGLCEKNKYNISSDALSILESYFKDMSEKRDDNFGNGRDVRNFFEKTITKQANRVAQISNASLEDLQAITPEDIDWENENSSKTVEQLLEELNNLVGLDNVKGEIKSLVNLVKVHQLRKEQGLVVPSISLHLVFSGNPGTGKTTVARYVSEILKALGIVSKGQLVETDRAGLVAGYVGQTATKTKSVIRSAIGGVLFIDEAYTLVGKGSNDFGQEAIDTLLKEMEDNRDNLIVIVAGYDNLMNDFIESNPGLKSRFTRYIHFDDYSSEELLSIFSNYCKKNQYSISEEAHSLLKIYFERVNNSNFGNGRGARNIFEKIVNVQATRVAEAQEKIDDISCIIAEDVTKVCGGI